MTAHHTAQGIASLGRYGDDLIVHMNQEEVAGLQALAKQHGASLSINPHTGMPEAFSLGKVFKAVLPIAAGFALGPGGFGLGESMFGAGSFMGSALGTGLLVGGATAALTGNIGTGIMAGLGAYGGHGLSDVWAKMGSSAVAAAPTASTNMGLLAKETGAPLVGAPNNFTALGSTGTLSGVPLDPVASFTKPMAFDATYGASTIAPSGSAAGSNFIKEGVNLANTTNAGLTASAPKTGITGLYDRFTDAGGKASQLYMPAAGAVLAGVEPADFYEQPLAAQEKQVYEQTGVDSMGRPTYGYVNSSAFNPYRTLNLSGPGPLKLAPPGYADGGAINSYAIGGPIEATAGSSVYGNSDGTIAQQTPKDDYGIGRLNNLARQQSQTQAQTYGYATGGLTALKHGGTPQAGGYLDGQGDGMSDSIPATIEGKQPARLADGEFVIPADVVSHLGNGSSKAGSKRLYAMMQKVRKARTGNPKQGKQINPNKYLMA